ncbi:MAG TPA: LytR C-terminal domain-containing protein [Mycobacteriales bacterium]|nr:LytR C-terminal domain-containing protein [Mycobacteriales bacterium]
MSENGGADEPVRPSGGRHRAAPNSRQRLLRWVAPLTSVAVVAAAIVVLVVVRGHSAGSGPGPGVISAATTPPVLTSSPTASSTPTPSVALTHPPPTQLPTPHVSHHRPKSLTAMAPVRVYNTTRITGLAHHVAAEIAAKGWTVPDVGNVRGVSPRTTLYYSPDEHAAARHLAHEFAGIQQVRPNSEAQVDYHGLTLVLTADWHD